MLLYHLRRVAPLQSVRFCQRNDGRKALLYQVVSVVCYRRRRLVFKREWRREKRQQDLDLDDEHSLSSVLKKFLDEKCEWCDRSAATPISTFETAAAEYCGMSSNKRQASRGPLRGGENKVLLSRCLWDFDALPSGLGGPAR